MVNPVPQTEQPERPTSLVVGVQFQGGGKVYAFDPGECADLIPGDFVIVNTAWGQQIGRVIYVDEVPTGERRGDMKPILGRATGADLILRQQLEEKAEKALEQARELVTERKLPIKLVTAEYTFDGHRLTILYESESQEGLKVLQQSLGRSLRTRIELRQVGPRDRAKLLGGYGACGEPRCCARFLSEFAPVSIRMGKAQEVSLTPSEITGMCNRLRCCLVYEYDMYAEAVKELPKRKARVRTPHGIGKVVGLLPLKKVVVVQLEDRRIEVSADEIEVLPQ